MLSLLKYVLRKKATIIESSQAEQSTVNNSNGLVLTFITRLSRISLKFVCLSLSFLMHRMLNVGQLVLEHCDPLIQF